MIHFAIPHINLGGQYEFCQNKKNINIQDVIENIDNDFKINFRWRSLILAGLQRFSDDWLLSTKKPKYPY